MKKTSEEWLRSITATFHSKGRDSWYIAYCPICMHSETATVLGCDKSAEIAARGKIGAHINYSHPDELTDPPPESEISKEIKKLKNEIFGRNEEK